MTQNDEHFDRQETLRRVNEVRAQALIHARRAQELARERRALIQTLIDHGLSQAEIGREMNVSRQAVQKMLAVQ
jgi:DNA-binding NarL/FixJ family response regulator